MIRMRVSVLAVLAVSIVAVSCGGSGSTPTAPSGAAGGATIGGVVSGAAAGGGSNALTTGGMTVTVSGTSLATGVDGQGRFSLSGVPAGTVQLNFTENGATASLIVPDVRESDQITIAVAVNGTSASLETEHRWGSDKVELEGKITQIVTGATPGLRVAGELVSVPSTTVIRHGDTTVEFSALRVGDRIHVKGTPGTPIVAELVMLQNPVSSLPPDPPPASTVQLEGRITAVNPGGTARTLLVEETQVSVPAGAEIRHGGTAIDFALLKVGDRVHVTGTMNGTVLVATQVNLQNDNPVSVNAKGPVTLLQSGFPCPSIRFTVEGWVIETSATTDFNKAPCSSIANGVEVHVKGTPQASGRVLADWVQVQK